jgi:autotransporter-associated beta strand protein
MTSDCRILGRIASRSARIGCGVAWFLLIGAGLGAAQAETRTWTGASSLLWSNPANWSPAGVPQDGDDLVFSSTTSLTSENNLPTVVTLHSLRFEYTHTIDSGTGIAISDGGIVALQSAAPADILVPVTLTADQTWTASGGLLRIYGSVALNTRTLTISGDTGSLLATYEITGTGAIIKTGDNAVWETIGGGTVVGFTGPITIEQGRVDAYQEKALGVEDGTAGNGTVVKAGATLRLNDTLSVNEAIELNGTGVAGGGALTFTNSQPTSIHGPVTLATSASINSDVGGNTTVRFTAPIAGPGDLTIRDGTVLELQAASNTFGRARFAGTGAGTLRMSAWQALTSTGGVDLPATATLDLNSMAVTLPWLGGNGTITNSGAPQALTIANTTDLTFTGAISGISQFIKEGAGTFVLGAPSQHTGFMHISGGTVRITHANGFGTGSGNTVIVSPGTLVIDGVSPGSEEFILMQANAPDAATLRVTNAAPITIAGSLQMGPGSVIGGIGAGADLTVSGLMTGSDFTVDGVTLHAASAGNSFGGTMTVGAGALYDVMVGGALGGGQTGTVGLNPLAGGTIAMNGTLAVVGRLTGAGTLNFGNGGTLEVNNFAPSVFAGSIVGSGSLLKTSLGPLTLAGPATFIGNVAVTMGELIVAHAMALPTQQITIHNGGSLVYDVATTHTGALSITGMGPTADGAALRVRGGNVTQTGPMFVNGNSNGIDVTAPHQLVLQGVVTGANLTATGTGAVILANASNPLMEVSVGAADSATPGAIVRLGISAALPPLVLMRIYQGATFELNGFSQTLNAVMGTGRIDTGAASGALTLAGAGGAVFEGTLHGAGSVAVNVQPSVFKIAGTHTLTGPFTTNSTLNVEGTLPAHVQTTGNFVTLQPGSSLGPLTLNQPTLLVVGGETNANGATTGSLTLSDMTLFMAWLTGTAPRVAVNGTVTLAGNLDYQHSDQIPLPAGRITLIENDGADPIVGAFINATEGQIVVFGDVHYRLSYAGGDGNDLTLTPPMMSYHLAEGATGSFFDTDLVIANPNDELVDVEITFLPETGPPIVVTETLLPMSRETLPVDSYEGLESASFSTIVKPKLDFQIVVERTMRWDRSGYGGHTEKATSGPAPTWYFAEGSEGFFRTFLLLANPHATANVAHVQWLREGAPAIARDYDLLPSSRRTIAAIDDPDLVNQAFGITVTFDQPGVAERAMYFGMEPVFKGGHESAGVTAPSPTWLLAEGATGAGFDTFILVSNPGTEAADVTFTFLPEEGAPASITRTVAAASRITINPEGENLSIPLGPVATQIVATKPVIAERAQYWPLGPVEWTEAHNSFGVTEAATKWGLAEGRAGGDDGYQTYILLANPGLEPATVTLRFLGDDNFPTPATRIVTVPAQRRVNVSVDPTGDDREPGDPPTTFGTLITSDRPIVVERAMYWNVNGEVWAAGTNATATRLP